MLNTFVAQCFVSLIHVQSSCKLAWGGISLQINWIAEYSRKRPSTSLNISLQSATKLLRQ